MFENINMKKMLEIAGVDTGSDKAKKLIESAQAGRVETHELQRLADNNLTISYGDDHSYLYIVKDVPKRTDLDRLMRKAFTPEEIESIYMYKYWDVESEVDINDFIPAGSESDYSNYVSVVSWRDLVSDTKEDLH